MKRPTFIAASVSFLMAIQSYAGGISAGGGDAVGQEFTRLGKLISRYLNQLGDRARAFGIDPNKFDNVVSQTWVRSNEHTYLGAGFFSPGQEVDAINYPTEGKIIVNRTRWEQENEKQKLNLAFHEYLGILGLSDGRYEISAPFLQKYGDTILVAGISVSECEITAHLQLHRGFDVAGSPVIAEISGKYPGFTTLKSQSPFDPPPRAYPTRWIDFNDWGSSPNSDSATVIVSGDQDLLKKVLNQELSATGRRESAVVVFGVDELDRINLFSVTQQNFNETLNYGELERHIVPPVPTVVDLQDGTESIYSMQQTFDLSCKSKAIP